MNSIVLILTFASDVQIWSEVDLGLTVNRRVQLTMPVVARNSSNLTNPQLLAGGCIADITALKWLSISTGYLAASLPHTGAGYLVHIPLAAATLKHRLGRLQLSDRSRLETLFGLPNSPIRYRNKVAASIPLAHGNWIPFASNETFYDFSRSAWTQNRFQAGLGRRLNPHFRLDGYFLERTDLQTHRNRVHAIGVTLAIQLNPQPNTN